MPGVTISAGYGAGGSVVGPAVATLLGLPLLDRAISSTIASELHVSIEEAEGGQARRSIADRFLSILTPLAGGVLGAGTDAAPPTADLTPDDAAPFRDQAEAIMRDALATGAVILGRAGAAAFHDEPGVLRVRLFGPTDARIDQGMRLDGVNRETAAVRLPEVDRARAHYVRRLYGVDIDEPSFFHLQLDSTALPLDSCVDLIASAYLALPRD
jgi:cytidylate kinase